MTELASTSGREKGVPWRRELRVVDKNREENFTGPRFRRWNWMKQNQSCAGDQRSRDLLAEDRQ
jgi:hypothetical protein